MIFVQNFTQPDFQATSFTLQIDKSQISPLATSCSLAGHRKARGRGEGSVGEGREGQEGEEVSLLRDEGHRHDHDGGGGGGDEKKDEEKS